MSYHACTWYCKINYACGFPTRNHVRRVLYVQTMAKLVDLIDNSTISCGNETAAK